MDKILDRICGPNDIHQVRPQEYDQLAGEIRSFLVEHVSRTGGHLASNLGVVELTMALHIALNLPDDKIIWDVGHQSYVHKLLTGRKDAFDGLRTFGGISGFPKCHESDCDAFDTGHSSTSISAALGLAHARDLSGGQQTIVAVIGDGSLTGGMAYEAMNNAARLKSNLIIILNDNKMSISENVGGIHGYLNDLRVWESYIDLKADVEAALRKIPLIGDDVVRGVKRSKDTLKHKLIPGGMFVDMGLDYMGPVNGHDVRQLVRVIRAARRKQWAVLVHVITEKGKGYAPAEADPSAFHGVGRFDAKTGKVLEESAGISYTKVFSGKMLELGKKDPDVVAVCAAMPYGTGLQRFGKTWPERFFDVGIAEEHAVTFAAGLAAGGKKPYVAIYSSFLQRAYDQLIHDICMPGYPVTLCVDRAGIVGADGETHQGLLDLSYLASIPGMTVFAPKNRFELEDILDYSLDFNGPLAIRYPRGTADTELEDFRSPIVHGKSEWLREGERAVILAVGHMVPTAMKAAEILESKGICPGVVNVRFVAPMDTQMLETCAADYDLVVTLEENMQRGGYGEAVCACIAALGARRPRILTIGIPDTYVPQGETGLVRTALKLDPASIAGRILDSLEDMK